MKKVIFFILLLVMLFPLFSDEEKKIDLFQLEIGMGLGMSLPFTPDSWYQNLYLDFHTGVSVLYILYVSADLMVLPPAKIFNVTKEWDLMNLTFEEGAYDPGLMLLINGGIRPKIGPWLIKLTGGINFLIVNTEDFASSFGVNAALGTGFQIGKHFNFMIECAMVFKSIDEAKDFFNAVKDLEFSPEYMLYVADTAQQSLYPSLIFNLVL